MISLVLLQIDATAWDIMVVGVATDVTMVGVVGTMIGGECAGVAGQCSSVLLLLGVLMTPEHIVPTIPMMGPSEYMHGVCRTTPTHHTPLLQPGGYVRGTPLPPTPHVRLWARSILG